MYMSTNPGSVLYVKVDGKKNDEVVYAEEDRKKNKHPKEYNQKSTRGKFSGQSQYVLLCTLYTTQFIYQIAISVGHNYDSTVDLV